MKKIAVTGTKGKTTVSMVLDDVLRKSGRHVLRVDTVGAYLDGNLKLDKNDSLKYYGTVLTRAPGRFLYLGYQEYDLEFDAVMECSLGCSTHSGLGYSAHEIGIFLNVFEDHLGSADHLKTREDIAKAKRFILERIEDDGYAIFNTDDKLVVKTANSVLPNKKGVKAIGFGLSSEPTFKTDAKLEAYFTVDSGKLVIKQEGGQKEVLDVADVSWTFNGLFEPSVYNLLAVVAALYAYHDQSLPGEIIKALINTRIPAESGRLVRLKSKNGIEILADYAHEKNSLKAVGDLASQLKDKAGKVIGVVRLAYTRTDDQIKDTAANIVSYYDYFIVYDKVDGFWQKADRSSGKFTMVVGHVSDVFNNALKDNGAVTERILQEDHAITRAAELAKPGDVVVIIVNEDIARSIAFIRDSFDADLV